MRPATAPVPRATARRKAPTSNRPFRGRTARDRAARILAALEQAIPTVAVELSYRSPFQLLIATILSAQSTDRRVNDVTRVLFPRLKRPADYAAVSPAMLADIIRPAGLVNAKARHLIGCGRALTERFGGQVPGTMEDLVSLPGVGRKTANVILGHAFGQPAIIVDTHVTRVARRLGFASTADPERIESELQRLIPETQWTAGSQRLLLHGRYVCTARAPKCGSCAIYGDCPWEGKRPR